MDTVDKIYFVFAVYDFNNASILSADECTLMLRSVTKGLAKLFPSQAPGFLANAEGDIFADLIPDLIPDIIPDLITDIFTLQYA